MTSREFISWLRSYIKKARDTEDNIKIATALSTVQDDVQTNPYWSHVSTTVTDNVKLNYSVNVDPSTKTYTVTN